MSSFSLSSPPVPVESSLLASVHYDAEKSILDLEFHPDGVIYRYFGVPAEIHHRLLAAESKGSFFNSRIRNRFPYQRLTLRGNLHKSRTLIK